MMVYVFVEGPSDRGALEELWRSWKARLRESGHGIAVIPLDDKSRFFRKLGPRAAEKLIANSSDLVVGLPDMYPNEPYWNSPYRHESFGDLQKVQRDLVAAALQKVYGQSSDQSKALLTRFLASALKHDLEMLLLAAKNELKDYLKTRDNLGAWQHPVENQNQLRPPKTVVQELFRTKRGWQYRDTLHAPAVLRKVSDLGALLHNEQGQLQCPVFKETLDWIGRCTKVAAYGDQSAGKNARQ